MPGYEAISINGINFKFIGLIPPGFEPTRFRFPDLPSERRTLLIRPFHLVEEEEEEEEEDEEGEEGGEGEGGEGGGEEEQQQQY